MAETLTIPEQIEQLRLLLRRKLGARGRDFGAALERARSRLPAGVYGSGQVLVQAQSMLSHPRLALTLDRAGLDAAAGDLRSHLEAIDLSDRRKGWWLGMLGGLAFNLLLMVALMITLLVWRGIL